MRTENLNDPLLCGTQIVDADYKRPKGVNSCSEESLRSHCDELFVLLDKVQVMNDSEGITVNDPFIEEKETLEFVDDKHEDVQLL